jgi:hypothetical protein
MGGGLMQLVAYGAQDIYLTGNPQITFFKVVYRRHTNFSLESIEQTFNGNADFGKKVSCTISRNGDLVHKIYLETTLPTITGANSNSYIRWVNYIGETLIHYAEVEIGGQRIDRQYGEWMHIWNQISLPAGHDIGYNRIVGNVPQLIKNSGSTAYNGGSSTIDGIKLYIPLQFWFCRNPGLALPLIALQYHEVKINIEFLELKDLLIITNGSATIQAPNGLSLSNTSLWVDYIFLDVDERRRFAQMSHEYLIEQLQYPGEETITTQSNKIRLNFNHPVKEIIWVAQKNQNIAYKQWYNYTDRLDSTPTSAIGTFGSNLMYSIVENIDASSGGVNVRLRNINEDQGENTCALAKIQLNGQDRFAERSGDYFTYVQSLNHHTRTPAPGINIYSFGLKPEEHQPSGTCNFSRIDNANLFITVTANTVKKGTVSLNGGVLSESNPSIGQADNAKVRIYCTNYNVLRIMSGMGGLAYSN